MKSLFRLLNIKRFYSRYILSIKYGLKLNKPLLLYKIITNYIGIFLFKKQPLRTIDFAPTYRCNMSCEHCFAAVLKNNAKPLLSVKDYARIAREADKLGAVHIAFQGGEPLVQKNIFEIIEAIKPSRFIVSLTTNGYLITEDIILRLKQLQVDMLTISIDSGIPEEHNMFRHNQNAFQKALDAVDCALKHGISVCINTMVTHQNLRGDGFKKIINFCEQKNLKLTVMFPAMAGKWQKAYELMLTPEDHAYLNIIMKKYVFIRRDLDANYHRWGCGAVKEMLYITAYGDVLPCSYIHATLGNIRDENLSDIRTRGLRVKEFSDFYPNCPPMEDMEFINNRLKVTVNKEKLPVSFDEMFPDYSDKKE
jgi:MoaA/NifB/PqqE/SkfB family radical SAM enzyme